MFDDPIGAITGKKNNSPFDPIKPFGSSTGSIQQGIDYLTGKTPLPNANDLRQQGRGNYGSLGDIDPGDIFSNTDKNSKQNQENAAQEQVNQSVMTADQARKKQLDFANTLKQNAFRDEQGLLNQVAGSERRSMAEKMHQAKENANRRGLVGSGFQKKAEAEARSQAAANTSTKGSQIHQLGQEQIQDAQNLAVQLGLEMGGISQSQSDQYYQMAIQNMNQRNAALGGIMQGIGYGAGAYLGSQNNANTWNPNSTSGNYTVEANRGY